MRAGFFSELDQQGLKPSNNTQTQHPKKHPQQIKKLVVGDDLQRRRLEHHDRSNHSDQGLQANPFHLLLLPP